jgi:hypothetical protein
VETRVTHSPFQERNYLPRMSIEAEDVWAIGGTALHRAVLTKRDDRTATPFSTGPEMGESVQLGDDRERLGNTFPRIFAYERFAAALKNFPSVMPSPSLLGRSAGTIPRGRRNVINAAWLVFICLLSIEGLGCGTS